MMSCHVMCKEEGCSTTTACITMNNGQVKVVLMCHVLISETKREKNSTGETMYKLYFRILDYLRILFDVICILRIIIIFAAILRSGLATINWEN